MERFVAAFTAAIGRGPFWDTWPFTPGYGDFWSSLFKFVYVAVILTLVCLFLRFLFGPKGIFRDKEMDREAAEARAQAMAELERRFKAGEISEAYYTLRKREYEG